MDQPAFSIQGAVKCWQLVPAISAHVTASPSPKSCACGLATYWRLVAFYNSQLDIICYKHKWIRLQIKRSEIPCRGTEVSREGTEFQYGHPLHLCISLCFATGKEMDQQRSI